MPGVFRRAVGGRAVARIAAATLVVAVALGAVGEGLAARGAQAVSTSFFGIYGWSPDRPIERSSARSAGAALAQVAIDWGQIEFDEAYNDVYFGRTGDFDYSGITPWDQRVRAVAESGFQPILLIVNPPAWALQSPNSQGPVRADKVVKYVDFVKRLTQRYAAPPYNVRYVVLFPEPDARGTVPAGCEAKFPPLHRGWGDASGQFVTMLSQAYAAIKSADARVNVIMGALAYDNFGGSNRPGFNAGDCGPFNYTFLDEVLAAGGASYVDAFAFNAYAVFAVGWEQQPQANGAFDVAAKTSYIRSKFPQIAAKPMFVLESGVWSDASVGLPVRMPDGSTGSVTPTEDWQAAYPVKLFARGLSVGLNGLVWYGMRDYPSDVQRGLLNQQDQPKRSFYGYQQAVLRLAGTDFVSRLTPRSTQSGQVEGYVFATARGGRVTVLWAVGDASSRARATIDVPGGGARAYDAVGNVQSGVDVSGDAATLEVGFSPVYVLSGPLQLRNQIPLIPRSSGLSTG